jgi:hypothetical protein
MRRRRQLFQASICEISRFAFFRFFLRPMILWLVTFGLAAAWAQDASTGALRGSVLDAQGAAVTNADIVAICVETGVRYHTATDVAGRFVMDLLPPGEYSARAEAEGMSPQLFPTIHVAVGASAHLMFKLAVAGPKETVTVSAEPHGVETNPSAVSALLDEQALANVPLNGRRFTDLLLLTPGVTQDPRGLTSGSNGDLSYGGIRGYHTSYLVDGADNNNGFFAQARGRYRSPYQFSNEVVSEFRVSSNSYGAESGRAGGAVVNVITKSGSNNWHGSAFYYLRDSSVGGAAPPFVGFSPSDQQHQFGGTLGGPIERDKMFFFAGYDQHIFHVPTVVEFLNGQAVVVPQLGTPGNPLDYEICDPAIGGSACDQAIVPGCPPSGAGGPPCVPPSVVPAAAQLSTLGGTFHSKLLGNAGFFKLDRVLSAHELLSARLSTSRYFGANNVFFDPANPITNYAMSGNGEEDVTTESASLSLLSSLTPKWTSHLRAQFSRDLEQSFPNSTAVRAEIYNWISDMGQSSILPRQTREHRLHLAETMSVNWGRQQWKFGGDAMRTWDYNYFPSLYGGEYIFNFIAVDPWTFQPMHGGLYLTPLRAWAHTVMPSWNADAGNWTGPSANLPRYYVQNFGNPVSHPDSNDYAAFVQDTVRLTRRLSVSAGVRYDRQTFGRAGLVANPQWPATGTLPSPERNFAPRVGLAYAIGDRRPLVVRAGYGIFYVRIPQIYQSAVINNNGVTDQFLSLDNTDSIEHQVFPSYPNPAVKCPRGPVTCTLPASWQQYATNEVAAFGPGFKTPRVQQGSLRVEREFGAGITGAASYLYVHGVDMIRARDVNLPPPAILSYPVFDPTGNTFENAFYDVPSFATWQTSYSQTCPYPPCINPLQRPIPQLGSIDQFESAASSVYHGLTLSLQKRMSRGLYFRLAYTWAHSVDDGQDALVAGQPATVQNSYSTKSERGPSVTDQRHRLTLAAVEEPHPFDGEHGILSSVFNHWKFSGVMTYGSGRPANAAVSGDPNQDGNTGNDRLAGYGRNAFLGPDYATMALRLGRKIKLGGHLRLELMGEAFNLFNRDNKRYTVSDNGFYNSSGQFIRYTKQTQAGGTYYPAYYQQPTSFMKATSAYAPRQLQLSVRLKF